MAKVGYVRDGDQLIVTRIDRLARSTQHLCQIAETPNADPERMKDNTVLVGGTTTKEVLAD